MLYFSAASPVGKRSRACSWMSCQMWLGLTSSGVGARSRCAWRLIRLVTRNSDQPNDQQPGEGKVPAPRGGEVVGRGDCRPAGDRPSVERKPGMVEVRAKLPPVEVRVGVEDHQPAHQHDENGQRVEPVPQARRQAMAVGDAARRRGRRLRLDWLVDDGCIVHRSNDYSSSERARQRPLFAPLYNNR